jgi:DNA-binding NarL/FixJ family response regulator
LRGLGEAIDRQFVRWHLTPAEREVGLLLLKGLSHKEAAAARSTSETTIRQQALAIYRKSGLRNRSELSAFFLEDLLLPPEQR